jgi:putative DNA methylase
MTGAFREASRVLKPDGSFVCVYAHKTTAGWATLVDSLRRAGFVVNEAWPLEMEKRGRRIAIDAAALKSNIIIATRKRVGAEVGRYEDEVRPDLESTVRERVNTLWELGISGADLVIACVGAGLRAFTRFSRVEFANGEEVPAERFLTEVEAVVLESILGRLLREVAGDAAQQSLAGVDAPTRFYTVWRYTYKSSELDAGEAIVFSNGTHVELDGPSGLTSGARALAERKKGKYRLRDYRERGSDERLGMPTDRGEAVPIIDVLHRVLWLMENRPGGLGGYLREASPNREELRLVAHALAGPALRGGEHSDASPNAELSALARLTANWRSLIEDAGMTPVERDERRTGQKGLDFAKGGRT